MSPSAAVRLAAIVGGEPSNELRAVTRVGTCSGVLVSPDLLLTCAHCLDGPVTQVTLNGESAAVSHCERHPRYEPGRAEHDLGWCRLASPSAFAPITLADRTEILAANEVTLVGFGDVGAFVRAPDDRPRSVRTSIHHVGEFGLEAGTREVTACRGDSGGPALIGGEGRWRIIGLIRGSDGAICASATTLVPIEPQREWLERALGRDSGRELGGASSMLVGIVSVVLAALVLQVVIRRVTAR